VPSDRRMRNGRFRRERKWNFDRPGGAAPNLRFTRLLDPSQSKANGIAEGWGYEIFRERFRRGAKLGEAFVEIQEFCIPAAVFVEPIDAYQNAPIDLRNTLCQGRLIRSGLFTQAFNLPLNGPLGKRQQPLLKLRFYFVERLQSAAVASIWRLWGRLSLICGTSRHCRFFRSSRVRSVDRT